MTAQLRAMRWWDIDAVMRLERAVFVEDAWSETTFWSELAERDTRHYLVAEDDGALVGYAGLCAYSDDAYVQTIAVAPDHQHRGIGRALLSALLAAACAQGCRRVDLEVRADNDIAMRLYAQSGFRRVGVRRGYYQPSGVDAVVMRWEPAR